MKDDEDRVPLAKAQNENLQLVDLDDKAPEPETREKGGSDKPGLFGCFNRDGKTSKSVYAADKGGAKIDVKSEP